MEDKQRNHLISKFKWLIFIISGLLAFLSGCFSSKRSPTYPTPEEPTPTPSPVVTPVPTLGLPTFDPTFIPPTCYLVAIATDTPTVAPTIEPTATPTLPAFPIITPGIIYCYAPPLNPPTPNGTPWALPTETPVSGAGIKGTNPVFARELARKGFISEHAYARIAGRNA
jgi:hypothetical protein